jgi:serine/threonine protein kinase
LDARVTGTVLDGKYEIVRRMGSGGMGEVYLVRHLHLQELRVVKILRQDLAADPVAQKRFVREARLATQIKHPNVAILYDFSRLPDGSFYMVWEHIEGQDVGDYIRLQGPFPVKLAIRLGIQALRGLEAIHASGIIHRDFSPDNLMLMQSPRKQPWVKIIDLGLAKNLEADASLEITQVGTFMGKLQYCSPEQAGAASGEVLDRRTDLYSFGLVFYEMITGLPPFDSENQHGFIFKRLSEEPLPMKGRNPKVEVPIELDRLVRRTLERDREKRFPDAVTILQALDRIEVGLASVDTREVTMPPEVRRAAPPNLAPAEARRRSSSELSREERLDLLAQIERAGRRMEETSVDLIRAESALAAGRTEEARKLAARLEASHPRTPGLARLKERIDELEKVEGAAAAAATAGQAAAGPAAGLAAGPAAAGQAATPAAASPAATPAPASPAPGPAASSAARSTPPPAPGSPAAQRPAAPPAAAPAPRRAGGAGGPALRAGGAGESVADSRQRVADTEKVLDKYLKNKQLALARLALETLLELAPAHPNRADYENWVRLLAEEVEQDKRAEVALAAARSAIARRDFKLARKELAVVTRNDLSGGRADALAAELDAAERGVKLGAELEERKRVLEKLLEKRQVVEAEREIERLAGLGVSRMTLDFYRERLAAARSAVEQEQVLAPLEKRYRESLHARDWFAAREVAGELESAAASSPRAAAMFAEVERLESIHQKQQSVEQAVKQIDTFIERGEAGNAETAFRILLQMDPDNRHRKRIERQLRSLERARGH